MGTTDSYISYLVRWGGVFIKIAFRISNLVFTWLGSDTYWVEFEFFPVRMLVEGPASYEVSMTADSFAFWIAFKKFLKLGGILVVLSAIMFPESTL